MLFYFPSCNFTAASPQTSKRIGDYLKTNYDAAVLGCCRPGHKKPAAGDTALTVCMSCSAIIKENRPDITEINLLEWIASNPSFPYPDLKGASFILQDCFRARGKDRLFDAVRTVLDRLNARVIELEENRNRTEFCGTFRFNPMLQKNIDIAPNYFEGYMKPLLSLCSKAEQQKRLEEYCAQFAGQKVVCYCNSCLRGLKQANVDAVHLLDLLFPEKN